LPELTIPWLSGYENSSPVRVGNAASEQLQIDIFGEIADAIFQGYRLGLQPSKRGKALQPVISEYLATFEIREIGCPTWDDLGKDSPTRSPSTSLKR
jgi:GH15 family glucan-1,4-alpha-glucosidase